MSAFLTVAEVETLTGYRRPSAQVRFLKARLLRLTQERASTLDGLAGRLREAGAPADVG